jgi:major type 1 subunit fimbrin (pilin)
VLKKEGKETSLISANDYILYIKNHLELESTLKVGWMFKMNKFKTSLVFVSAFFVVGTSQAAQVNFSGEVTSQTCQFKGLNSNDSQDVPMSPVSQGDLQTVGQTTGATPFSLSLSGCTTNDDVDIAFDKTNADSNNAGTLKNTAGTGAAQNVNIQLVKQLSGGVNEPVDLNNPTTNSKQHVANGASTYTFNYLAQYYATGAAKAGSVKSNVLINIIYP